MPDADFPFPSGPSVRPAPFDAFYRRHVRAVLAYLLPRTADRDLADDICAEVFAVAAVQRAGRPAQTLGGERHWILSLAGDALQAGGLPR